MQEVAPEYEVAWMWEASPPGLSDSDVKWQRFPHDHVHTLEENFTAGNRDPFPIEVVYLFGNNFLEIGEIEAPAAAAVQVDTYGRPDTTLNLTCQHVLKQ